MYKNWASFSNLRRDFFVKQFTQSTFNVCGLTQCNVLVALQEVYVINSSFELRDAQFKK